MPGSADPLIQQFLDLADQHRAQVETLVRQTEAMLAADWQRGMEATNALYAPLLNDYARALADLRAVSDDPAAALSLDWLTSQNTTLASIEASVRAASEQYGADAAQVVTDAQGRAVGMGETMASDLTQQALFPASELGVNPAMLFNQPNPDALAQWVGRAGDGHPIGNLFDNFGTEATQQARMAMMTGLALGQNPRVIAQGIQQAMGISQSRATIIARTEVLGSYRQAAHETYRANSDVLNYWLWSAGGNNPCFPAGTMIATRRGRVAIEDVIVGDLVLTHRGQFRRVTKVMARGYRGPMTTIEADDGRRVTATASHPFLVERQGQLDWIEAGQLRLSDGLVSEHERTTKIIDHRLSDDPIERRIRQSHNPVALALEIERLASVAGGGASVPVDAINLQHGVDTGQVEVNRVTPAADDELLPVVDAERLQTETRPAFWLGLTSMAAIAADGAEATIRQCARLGTDLFTALKASEGMRGTAALLRAIMPSGRNARDLPAADAGAQGIMVGDGSASHAGGRAIDLIGPAQFGAKGFAAGGANTINAMGGNVALGGAVVSPTAAMLSPEQLAAMAANALNSGVCDLTTHGMGMQPLVLSVAGSGAKAPVTSRVTRRRDVKDDAAVLTSAFHIHSITRIAHHIQQSGLMVYNFDVEDDHTYVANGFAVHNCAMCMGMDGTLHDLNESLDDHPCGKCAPLPVTKGWDEILGPLGIDASELEDTSLGAEGAYETGEEKFAKMSPEEQRAILGTNTGYEAYRRGEVTLKDFVGVRPAEHGFPSSYYQKSLKELQIPTRQARRLVEPRADLLEKYAAGTLRYSDLGKLTPDELMPAWAKQSESSRIVYQILRNGLPYDLTAHEQGLLIVNLEQMLKGELPLNVRAAAERQLIALGQTVERQTVGEAALRADQLAAREVTQAATDVAAMAPEEARAVLQDAIDQAMSDGALARGEAYDREIIAPLADRLAGNPEWQRLFDKIRSGDMQTISESWRQRLQTPDDAIKYYIERWTMGSELPEGAAMRRAAIDEFDLANGLASVSKDAEVLARVQADYSDVLGGVRALLRAMHDQTQNWFEEHGIESVRLYRGLSSREALGAAVQSAVADVRPISSFSADLGLAMEFGSEYGDLGRVYALDVPISRILATPMTGLGEASKWEVLLLGGQYDGVMAGGVEFPRGLAAWYARETELKQSLADALERGLA